MTLIPDPADTAWRVHAALADLTGKTDTKAAFALSIESVALGAAFALSKNTSFGDVSGSLPSSLLWLGAVLLALAALLSMWAVLPRMKPSGNDRGGRSNIVYFGDLRRREPRQLTEALRTTDPLPDLGRQLVVMSQIVWRKQHLVQFSFATAAVGTGLLTAAFLTG
ncbi:Pycsar system effector family protein [Streptomyces sp. NPDC058694]|uniref:Pycsar system effector family protein n=1 Tax=Streptomyces sp. NPDC058694 TaxID=3346603 RepID=UPI00365C99A9